MKQKLITILFTAAALSACTGDLDQQPHTSTQTTASTVYGSEAGYQQALAKLYASYVIAGQEKGGSNADLSSNSGYDFWRGYFNLQEIPTEETAPRWLSGDKVKDLAYMSWDANDPWVADTYYRAYYTIALCNEFLAHATPSAVSGSATLQAYRAEARFLRALTYWYVLDLFGQGPYIDETMGVGAYTPACYNAEQLFDFIESELTDCIDTGLLPPAETTYGHASTGAAWALLARLYLNAETYGAGDHYTDCIEACQQVLSLGYSLETDYRKLFNADNHLRTNEIILAFAVDAEHTVSWGASTYIVCGQVSNDDGVGNPDDWGITAGWKMFRVRGELPELFAGAEESDSRCLFYTDGQSQWLPTAIDSDTEGYFSMKFTNLTDAGESASNTAASGVSTDLPIFRLAEVKLTLAEAVLRGGTGATRTEALQAVNDVRQRAYGDESGNINDAQLTLAFLLDERARELYLESLRRTDLIRYGLFTSADRLWQWKGGVADGRAVDDRYNRYPIPSAELSANPNLKNENY